MRNQIGSILFSFKTFKFSSHWHFENLNDYFKTAYSFVQVISLREFYIDILVDLNKVEARSSTFRY